MYAFQPYRTLGLRPPCRRVGDWQAGDGRGAAWPGCSSKVCVVDYPWFLGITSDGLEHLYRDYGHGRAALQSCSPALLVVIAAHCAEDGFFPPLPAPTHPQLPPSAQGMVNGTRGPGSHIGTHNTPGSALAIAKGPRGGCHCSAPHSLQFLATLPITTTIRGSRQSLHTRSRPPPKRLTWVLSSARTHALTPVSSASSPCYTCAKEPLASPVLGWAVEGHNTIMASSSSLQQPGALGDLLALAGSPRHPALLVGVLVAVAAAAWVLARVFASLASFLRIRAALADVPMAPGGNALVGHIIPMLTCVNRNKGAWDVMEEWMDSTGPIVKYRILGTWGIVVRDPTSMKRIFQNAFKIYEKDLELSYRPFLPILGTGLVTADGQLWQDQRKLMGPALRVEVLDDVIAITHRAVDRLSAKLAQHVGSGKPVEIEEEFRLLTLQIIGEAVLSLAPEESDRVRGIQHAPCMHAYTE